MTERFLKPKEAAAILGVHVRTLVRWEKQGQILAIKTPSGQRRYDVQSKLSQVQSNLERKTVIYARVSSRSQEPDLARQIKSMSLLYPHAEVIAEIGGGLNFKRPKLTALLEQVMRKDVSRIIIAHQDRLARFGFDFYEWFCKQYECEILVLNKTDLSPETEIVQDILAILHCFSSRLSGLRKYKAKVKEDTDLPKLRVKESME